MGGSPILELFAKLTLDDKEFDEKTNDAKSKWSGFASFLGKAGKVMAGAFAATTAATVALGKSAVDAYANYEQLAGGIQKLFGEESAGVVMDYAQKAFMTSGKSMNEYMNSVSQISASLKRSIGDDMEEVARVADIAMQAISDNVNTFGSDAEFVENAIMGLSRNNYTMIDNLKLGYAGSAEGMRQLINDSGVLGYELKSTADLANVGFDQMVLAIQAVQEQQGIAGTTAKEALTTIEGAGKATKAAWENLITAMGRGEGIQEAMQGLSDSIFGVGLLDGKETGLLNQILPRIQTVMEGIGDFVVQATPVITEKIPQIIISLIPSILNAASSMFGSVLSALPSLFSTVRDLIMNEGLGLINSLSEGFLEGIPEFLSNALPMLLSFTEGLRNDFGKIVDTGIEFIINFAQGLIAGLPQLIEYVPQIIENIAGLINDNAPKLLETAFNLIVMLGKGLIDNIPVIIANMGNIVSAIFSVIQAVNWVDLGGKVVTLIGNGIKALVSMPVEAIRNIGKSVFDTFKTGFSWKDLGKNIINGIVEGIKSVGGAIGDTIKGFASDALGKVKSFFKIGSPSKLMRDEIGRWIPEGIAEGIRENEDSVFNAMSDMPDVVSEGFNSGSYSLNNESSNSNLGTIVSLLQQIANGGMNVTLEGDANQLFKVVRKQAIGFERAKGYSAI